MDNNGSNNSNTPGVPSSLPPADAEEQKALDELKKLQTAEQSEVAADAKKVDDREAESKEMEAIEKSDPASLATPVAPPLTSNEPVPPVTTPEPPQNPNGTDDEH